MSAVTRPMILALVFALNSGTIFSQDVRRSPDGILRLSHPPVLVLAVNTTAVPAYTCGDGGCRLSSVVLVRSIGTPEARAMLDSADQSAYTANVLRRVNASWQFRIAQPTGDTLLYDLSLDSVEHVFGYDPRDDFGEPAQSPNLIYARAEIRDPVFLAALGEGVSMTVLTDNPSAASRLEQHIWLTDANRWMRRVQRAQHQLTTASRVTPTARPNRGAGLP